MATSEIQGELFPVPEPPEGTRVINDRCVIRTRDGHRLVIGSGIVLFQYAVGDRMAEAQAIVSLVEQGWADQNDVALAFGCSVRTVRRHQRRYEDGGLPALGNGRGIRRGGDGCEEREGNWCIDSSPKAIPTARSLGE